MARHSAKRQQAEGTTEQAGQRQIAATPLPLTDEEVDALFIERATPREGRICIARIRKNLPSRAVRSSRRAGKLRYPSRKMGFVTEAEAFHTEFVALVDWDFDDDNLEFFPQPAERLTITHRAALGNLWPSMNSSNDSTTETPRLFFTWHIRRPTPFEVGAPATKTHCAPGD